MIRIRRSGLPAGLYARAEAQGRNTVIYLLPGLPAADRRAALLRLRRNGSMGYGPALPAAALAVAVLLDRIRAVAQGGTASFRAHPFLTLPPTIIAVTAILAAATAAAVLPPQVSSPYRATGSAPSALARARPPARARELLSHAERERPGHDPRHGRAGPG
jgi:hypothetical protein